MPYELLLSVPNQPFSRLGQGQHFTCPSLLDLRSKWLLTISPLLSLTIIQTRLNMSMKLSRARSIGSLLDYGISNTTPLPQRSGDDYIQRGQGLTRPHNVPNFLFSGKLKCGPPNFQLRCTVPIQVLTYCCNESRISFNQQIFGI